MQGQTVMTFAAERAAYVSFGFLKGLYGPKYRAPKMHSTSLTRDNDVGVWFGEKQTGARPRGLHSLDWGVELVKDPLSRIKTVTRKDASRPHRLKKKVVARARTNPLVVLPPNEDEERAKRRAEKAAVAKAELERKLLIESVLRESSKRSNYPESPSRQRTKDSGYGVNPNIVILPVKPRQRSRSLAAPVRYAVEFLTVGRLAAELAMEVPPDSPPKLAQRKRSVQFYNSVSVTDSIDTATKRRVHLQSMSLQSTPQASLKLVSPPVKRPLDVATLDEDSIDRELRVGRYDTSVFGAALASGGSEAVARRPPRASVRSASPRSTASRSTLLPRPSGATAASLEGMVTPTKSVASRSATKTPTTVRKTSIASVSVPKLALQSTAIPEDQTIVPFAPISESMTGNRSDSDEDSVAEHDDSTDGGDSQNGDAPAATRSSSVFSEYVPDNDLYLSQDQVKDDMEVTVLLSWRVIFEMPRLWSA